MKQFKLFTYALLLLLSARLSAQTALFKPGPANGVDAMIHRNDVCPNWANTNYGNNPENDAYAWTWYAVNCGPGAGRTLLRFDDLNTLPAGTVITYAELRLFGPATSGNYQGNSYYPGSPYVPGDNACWLRRVTGGWTEMGVTWNTQPTTTTVDQVAVPMSTSQWNFNVALNVTAQVNAMLAPGANNGFMLQLQNENYYRSILFASSDHPDSQRWPELYIEYTLPCDANFTYCTSTQTPGTYNFTVDNVQTGYQYEWDFGDGNIAAGTSVAHTYLAPGVYTVCLKAYNPQTGVECKKCVEICVKQVACGVSFTYEAALQKYLYYFYAQTGPLPVVSYYWEFGDGQTSTDGPDVKHQYSVPGVYQVCLTVTYSNGCVARYCTTLYVGLDVTKTNTASQTVSQVPPGDQLPLKQPVQEEALPLKIIPNPAAGRIVVSVSAPVTGSYRYSIINAHGGVALNGTAGLQKGLQNKELDVQKLPPGKYQFEIMNGTYKMQGTFIKL